MIVRTPLEHTTTTGTPPDTEHDWTRHTTGKERNTGNKGKPEYICMIAGDEKKYKKSLKKNLELRKKVVPLQKKQQNQSNMVNEILRSEGAHTTSFHVIWTAGKYPHWRTYSREFQSLKDMAKFICKHPKRDYTSIRQDENWIEERENFMGFAGLHSVHCSKVVKDFLQMNIAWGSIANDEYSASCEELKKV